MRRAAPKLYMYRRGVPVKPNNPLFPPQPSPILTIRLGAVFAFLPDGERLVVSGTGPTSTARMVSAVTGQELFAFDKLPPNVRGAAVSDDGTIVALAALRDRVALYDARTGGKVQAFRAGNDDNLSGLEFFPGSHTLLHSSWHGLTAMDAAGHPTVRPLQVSGEYPDNTMYYAVAFSSGGDRFAGAWFDHTRGNNVSLFEWPSGEETDRLPYGGDDQPNQILFSPDGGAVVVRVADGSVVILPLGGATLPGCRRWIERAEVAPDAPSSGATYGGCLCFSPDGTLMAYGQRSMLGLWAWPSGECLGKWSLPGRNPMAEKVAFSPSGQKVAASLYSSRSVFLYRVAGLIGAGRPT